MDTSQRWYFLKPELEHTPSLKCGIEPEKELDYRVQAATLIQEMGMKLQVGQLVINTAIVYMHRFYMMHSFTRFHRNVISPAAIFLAAKVEEQPRKLEHLIRTAHVCINKDTPPPDVNSDAYQDKVLEVVTNENILLQTLGFDVAIDHPHTHVVKCCQLVRASRDVAQASYLLATSSLHLTTMCLQYKPTVVACVCIYLGCKWNSYEFQRKTEDMEWFYCVDKTVTAQSLDQMANEFTKALFKYPDTLKKLMKPNSTSTGKNPQRMVSLPPAQAIHKQQMGSVKVPQAGPTNHPNRISIKEYEKRERRSAPGNFSAPLLPPPQQTSSSGHLLPGASVTGGLLPHPSSGQQPHHHHHPHHHSSSLPQHAAGIKLHPSSRSSGVAGLHHQQQQQQQQQHQNLHQQPQQRVGHGASHDSLSHDTVQQWVQDQHSKYNDQQHRIHQQQYLLEQQQQQQIRRQAVPDSTTHNRRSSSSQLSVMRQAPEIKQEIKSEVKYRSDSKVDIKVDVKLEGTLLPDTKLDVKPKSEFKNEPKEENCDTFIFTNNDSNDFSLGDFLSFGDAPPENIFDTREPDDSNMVPLTHHKGLSPPPQCDEPSLTPPQHPKPRKPHTQQNSKQNESLSSSSTQQQVDLVAQQKAPQYQLAKQRQHERESREQQEALRQEAQKQQLHHQEFLRQQELKKQDMHRLEYQKKKEFQRQQEAEKREMLKQQQLELQKHTELQRQKQLELEQKEELQRQQQQQQEMQKRQQELQQQELMRQQEIMRQQELQRQQEIQKQRELEARQQALKQQELLRQQEKELLRQQELAALKKQQEKERQLERQRLIEKQERERLKEEDLEEKRIQELNRQKLYQQQQQLLQEQHQLSHCSPVNTPGLNQIVTSAANSSSYGGREYRSSSTKRRSKEKHPESSASPSISAGIGAGILSPGTKPYQPEQHMQHTAAAKDLSQQLGISAREGDTANKQPQQPPPAYPSHEKLYHSNNSGDACDGSTVDARELRREQTRGSSAHRSSSTRHSSHSSLVKTSSSRSSSSQKNQPPTTLFAATSDPSAYFSVNKPDIPVQVQSLSNSPVESLGFHAGKPTTVDSSKSKFIRSDNVVEINSTVTGSSLSTMPLQTQVSHKKHKEHKHDHHKHKEKKKHKRKEKDKDKHKDREGKEHKKEKKHKKNKDKDREREKKRDIPVHPAPEQLSTPSLKMKISRDKIMSTPEVKMVQEAVPRGTDGAVTPASTPGTGLKLRIPKALIQQSKQEGVNQDMGTPILKVKAGRDSHSSSSKESRKRDRERDESPADDGPVTKLARTSGHKLIPQVLDGSRWNV